MSFDRSKLRLCLVTDSEMAAPRSLHDIVAAAVRGGVTMVQLREKTAPTRTIIERASALLALLRPLDIPLVINDRADIALTIDADGLHVGQDDMPVDRVRALLGASKIVGLSITNLADLQGSPLQGVDYIGVGPVFAQTTKPDASPPLGLAGLETIRNATSVPILAIGGLDVLNVQAAIDCEIDGVAVVSAIMAAADPEAAARALRRSVGDA